MPSRRKFLAGGASAALTAAWPWSNWPGRLAIADDPLAGNRASSIPCTGEAPESLHSFDDLLQQFVREHSIPGAALAVTKGGKLMLARGYGYADVAQQQPVQPASLFRIASISKPITATAVLQLVEQGAFALDDGIHGLLKLPASTDPRWKQVTVRQLLQHTAGWDRSVSFDPMFRSVAIAQHFHQDAPANPHAIIRYMLEQPLDFEPGTKFAYSNFGYCLLGRLLEKFSPAPEMSYERIVQRRVLRPLGITRMKLGRTLADERATGEVKYYTRDNRQASCVFAKLQGEVSVPYGAWCLEAMDSHGGWIASAVDLARFAAAFDHRPVCPLLGAASVESMFALPAINATAEPNNDAEPVYYGCGWSVRKVSGGINTWHTGSLDGTSTLLVRRHDGLAWAVLFNTRDSAHDKPPGVVIDPLLHQAADAVKIWPEEDRFPRYF